MRVAVRKIAKCIAIAVCCTVVQQATAQSKYGDDLTQILIEMGGHEVNLSGCAISYSVKKSPAMNVKYKRWINLAKFDFDTISPTRSNTYKNKRSYYLNIERSERHYDETFPFIDFQSWVRKTYPNTDWPYRLDEHTQQIEKRLIEAIPNITEMTRFEFTEMGQKRTYVEALYFTMGHNNETYVEDFRKAIVGYAKEFGCVEIGDAT